MRTRTKLTCLLAATLGGLCMQAHAITYTWSIDKIADRTELLLAQGQSAPVNYTLSITRTPDFVADGPNVDECVEVIDSLVGDLGQTCDSLEFSYGYSVGPYALDGIYSLVNTATLIGANSGTRISDSWTVRIRVGDAQVPEPGSLALLGLGLAGLGVVRRRKPN